VGLEFGRFSLKVKPATASNAEGGASQFLDTSK
jgi:hypothetical protein